MRSISRRSSMLASTFNLPPQRAPLDLDPEHPLQASSPVEANVLRRQEAVHRLVNGQPLCQPA